MMTQKPVIGLVPGEARTVYAALLSGADAYRVALPHVAYGIGLRVFQRD